ncbi:MAG: TetR/AcrR family transcriptional regulator [Microthrixaceae bacterium]
MRLPAAERRTQLLATAETVFADKGYHATSMNDVAEAAGVTKPVLYQHFSSKRELFVELLGEIGQELQETIAKATADAAGPRQQIENGFRAYFGFVGARTAAFRVLFGSGARRDPEFASFARTVEDSIARTIAELIVVDGRPVPNRLVLAHGIVGMTEATSRYWLAHDREPDIDTLAQQLSRLAWSGMRGLDRGNER